VTGTISITGGNVYAYGNNPTTHSLAYNYPNSVYPAPTSASGAAAYPVYVPTSLSNGSASQATAGVTFSADNYNATADLIIAAGSLSYTDASGASQTTSFTGLSGYNAVMWLPLTENAGQTSATGKTTALTGTHSFAQTIGLQVDVAQTFTPVASGSFYTNVVQFLTPGKGVGFIWSPQANATATSSTHMLMVTGPITLTTDNNDPNWAYGSSGSYVTGAAGGSASPDHSITLGADAVINVIPDTEGTYGTVPTDGINCSPASADVNGIDCNYYNLTLSIAKGAKGIAAPAAPGLGLAGIHVPAPSSLSLTGAGALVAKGAPDVMASTGAGIGGNGSPISDTPSENVGDIKIGGSVDVTAAGGTIQTGGMYFASGAGIGSGGGYGSGSSSSTSGKETAGSLSSVTISTSGIVVATGGVAAEAYSGAGIGTGGDVLGVAPTDASDFGNITINSGTVIAVGGTASGSDAPVGAGIGSGAVSRGVINTASRGTVSVSGGTVIALGSADAGSADVAAGIGSGSFLDGTDASNAKFSFNLNVSGGSVCALAGGAGAFGIGSGQFKGATAPPTVGANSVFTITGGSVYASGYRSGKGAGGPDSMGLQPVGEAGTSVYPTYVQAASATTGSVEAPAAASALPHAYIAPLHDLASPTLGKVLGSEQQSALVNAGVSLVAPSTDPLSACLWLPGTAYDPANQSFTTAYSDILLSAAPALSGLVANVEDANKPYGPAASAGSALADQTNLVTLSSISLSGGSGFFALDVDNMDAVYAKSASYLVKTNNPTGYQLSLSTSDTDTLTGVTYAKAFQPTAASTLSGGTWGYALVQAALPSSDTAAPPTSAPSAWQTPSTSSPTTLSYAHPVLDASTIAGRPVNLWVGAFSGDLAADTYTGRVILTATVAP
jgi:hypothetical protein